MNVGNKIYSSACDCVCECECERMFRLRQRHALCHTSASARIKYIYSSACECKRLDMHYVTPSACASAATACASVSARGCVKDMHYVTQVRVRVTVSLLARAYFTKPTKQLTTPPSATLLMPQPLPRAAAAAAAVATAASAAAVGGVCCCCCTAAV